MNVDPWEDFASNADVVRNSRGFFFKESNVHNHAQSRIVWIDSKCPCSGCFISFVTECCNPAGWLHRTFLGTDGLLVAETEHPSKQEAMDAAGAFLEKKFSVRFQGKSFTLWLYENEA